MKEVIPKVFREQNYQIAKPEPNEESSFSPRVRGDFTLPEEVIPIGTKELFALDFEM